MKYFTLARHYFFMTKFIYCNMELVLLSLVETFTEKQKISIKLRYWCKTLALSDQLAVPTVFTTP